MRPFNCNGDWGPEEWNAAFCSAYQRVDVIGGPGLLNCFDVHDGRVKCTMNSSPKTRDDRCVRGAVVPGACVEERSPLCHVPQWSIEPDVSIEPVRDQCGYLAQFKAAAGEEFTVTVCMPPSAGCKSARVTTR